jgi:hypothetical protein
MKTLNRDSYNRARNFLKSKARRLDLAQFEQCFEGGLAKQVVSAIVSYQNEDGGFGQALEPDLRSPSSSAEASGIGLSMLKEIGVPSEHPMVQNAVQYLLATFNQGTSTWRVAPQDVNEYPHAPWWHDEGGSLARTFDGYRIIPRAKIVGLLHHYADLVPEEFLSSITEQTVSDIETIDPFGSGGGDDLVYALSLVEEETLAEEFRARVLTRLCAVVPEVVSQDPAEWGAYCISPLKIVTTPQSPVADLIWDAIQEHLDYQIDHQTPEGAWDPVWSWGEFYPQVWQGAKVEWQGHLTLETLTTLNAFGRIEGST